MVESSYSPDLLWQPTAADIETANLTRYRRWLFETRGLTFDGYWDLHAWSTEHVEDFWESLFEYFAIETETPYTNVLTSAAMPSCRWFPGASVNFARHIVRAAPQDGSRTAIYYQSEGGPIGQMSWATLVSQISSVADFLRSQGVGIGDAVVAYVTNIPEAIIAFLATASIGAVWSSCSPEFGEGAVVERFGQLSPKVLIAVDGYRFGGKQRDRTEVVRALSNALPTLECIVHIQSREWQANRLLVPDAVPWADIIAYEPLQIAYEPLQLSFAQVTFDHPLFVCFSSGTTGIPKAIVHGHGGITLESFKLHILQNDTTPSSRNFFYTTTGWIVWMSGVVSNLIAGGSVIIYDGNPIAPDPMCLWRLAEATKVTSFGASPVFFSNIMNSGKLPKNEFDLSNLREVTMTGSPASPEVMRWIADNIAPDVRVTMLSGGTELSTAIVGSCSVLPSYAGEFQCAQLGVDAVAFSESGARIVGEVGELVIRKPMPTMPLYFLNDPGNVRLQESYFSVFPGIWRHGDFFMETERKTSLIYGRSDATLNRNGIRIGTAELYCILETIPEISDSLVVNIELTNGKSFMPLFVELAPKSVLDETLIKTIKHALATSASPRHVPDQILACDEVPYTISGKKLEVPVKKILMGAKASNVANPGAMRNPHSLTYFERVAKTLLTGLVQAT